jgi:hypothetical protein
VLVELATGLTIEFALSQRPILVGVEAVEHRVGVPLVRARKHRLRSNHKSYCSSR